MLLRNYLCSLSGLFQDTKSDRAAKLYAAPRFHAFLFAFRVFFCRQVGCLPRLGVRILLTTSLAFSGSRIVGILLAVPILCSLFLPVRAGAAPLFGYGYYDYNRHFHANGQRALFLFLSFFNKSGARSAAKFTALRHISRPRPQVS